MSQGTGPAPGAASAAPLGWGDHAPWFTAPALGGNPRYKFDTAAGRHMLLLFFGSAAQGKAREALRLVARHRSLFDDDRACFFGVSCDPEDLAKKRIAQSLPGIRFFLDFDRAVSRLYRVAGEGDAYRPCWLVLDPGLRVLGSFPLPDGPRAIALLRARIGSYEPEGHAPVLAVPDVLEPALCRELIAAYEKDGGEESGFMREQDGKTVLMYDPSHKQRRDHVLEDAALIRSVLVRLNRRLTPAIRKAFAFTPTRIERHLVACYEPGHGHFRPHRDNTTAGTAHRRFAVTLNLNAEDYEGGDLRFPEYGTRTYRASTGGAIVFSCSLLHEATPVLAGRRFAYLPFLYDEEAARIREANNPHLGPGLDQYRADPGTAPVGAAESEAPAR